MTFIFLFINICITKSSIWYNMIDVMVSRNKFYGKRKKAYSMRRFFDVSSSHTKVTTA